MSHTDPHQPGLFDDDPQPSIPAAPDMPSPAPDTDAADESPVQHEEAPRRAGEAVESEPVALEITWAERVWDTAAVPTLPTMLVRTDGQPLLYPGKSHTIAGEPGAGKSWLAQAAAAQLLTAVGAGVLPRLRGHRHRRHRPAPGARRDPRAGRGPVRLPARGHLPAGAGDGTAAGRGHRPHPGLGGDRRAGRGDGAAGMDENSNKDATRWHKQVVRPLNDAGVTTLTIDHISKASAANGAARTSYARGASAKLADVTGAAYLLTSRVPFSAHTPGRSELIVMKDRFGQIGPRGQLVAHVSFTPTCDTRGRKGMQVRLDKPPAAEEAAAALRTQITTAIAEHGPINRTAVRKLVRGNNTRINAALAALLADGVLVEQTSRGGTLLALTDPDTDPGDGGEQLAAPEPPAIG